MGLYGHLWPARRLGDILARRGHRVIAWADPRFRCEVEGGTAEYREAARPGGALAAVGRRERRRPTSPRLQRDRCVARGHRGGDRARGHRGARRGGGGSPRARLHGRRGSRRRRVARPAPRVFLPAVPAVPPPRTRAVDGRRRTDHEAARYAVASEWGVDLGDWAARSPTSAIHIRLHDLGGLGHGAARRLLADDRPAARPRTGPRRRGEAAARQGRPWIYVAFGTLFSGRPELFRAVLEAMADDELDVLAGTVGASIRTSSTPCPTTRR